MYVRRSVARCLLISALAASVLAGPARAEKVPADSEHKRVFVTQQTFNGGLDGVRGADRKCQRAAREAGLQGTFKAWVAGNDTNDPADRFRHAEVPYARTDGVLVAENWADLTDGELGAAIDHSASGAAVADGYSTWTNVSVSGEINGEADCEDWTASRSRSLGDYQGWNTEGNMGDFTVPGSSWTQFSSAACQRLKRLYCFEQ